MDTSPIADIEIGKIDHESGEENKNIDTVVTVCDTSAVKESVIVEVEVSNEVRPSPKASSTQEVIPPEVVEDLRPVAYSNLPETVLQQEFDSNKRVYYPGDVVVVKEDRPLNEWQPFFGTVLKPGQGTDMARSDDKGLTDEFHVHWDLTNRITMIKGFEVALVDRSLFRGQKVENKNGDIGVITAYDTKVSVQISGTTDVLEDISIHRLRPITPHVRGQEVVLDGWVGVITGIKRNVWFKPDGGPMYYLEAFERDGFTRTDPFWGLGIACPGMRTRLASGVLKKANWSFTASKFFSRLIPLHYIYSWTFSTIVRTEVTDLEIKWLQPVPGSANPESLPVPNEIVTRERLGKVLIVGTPSTETIGIGSVRKMNILPQDEISNYNNWLEGFKQRFIEECNFFSYPRIRAMNATSPLKEMAANTLQETPVRVLLRHNTVTVKWENGTVENIPTVDVPKISSLADDGEFPAGLTVAHVQKDTSHGDRYGIVMESSALAKSRSRKVNVLWIVDGQNDGVREESVFDIKPHSIYSMYHRGTILFPRNTAALPFKSAVVIDVNIPVGKMVVIRSSDNLQDDVYPHQVVALAKRCHWSFFTRQWTIDDMIPPPYQLELEHDPANRLLDVSDQRLDVLLEDPNNPQEAAKELTFPTLWDEPSFELLGFAPQSHRYYGSSSSEKFGKAFANIIGKEMEFLKTKDNITEGIWLRSYENRMDLMSVLMVGPAKTPYEDGLFLFDLQLPADFPSTRPAVHFVSYTLEIHPLLSYDGNVCVSVIPWEFSEATELPQSYIMHFLNKLQALLFTPTPYFASPAKKAEQSTESGRIKSELYNQGVFVRVLDSMWNMLQRPHEPWEKSIHNHFATAVPEKLLGIEKWMNGERAESGFDYEEGFPSYPLSSMPDGLVIALKSRMDAFKKLIKQVPTVEIQSVTDTTADSESHSVVQQAPVIPTESSRRVTLTPITELTEPSSTSTFGIGNKLSNLSVSSHDQDSEKKENPPSTSLDSLKNVKQSSKGAEELIKKVTVEIEEVGSEAEKEVEKEKNENLAAIED